MRKSSPNPSSRLSSSASIASKGQARARHDHVGVVEAARHADRHLGDVRTFTRRLLSTVSRRVASRRGEQEEAALSADQRDGGIDDQSQERKQLHLAHELARDSGEDFQVVALPTRGTGEGRLPNLPHRDGDIAGQLFVLLGLDADTQTSSAEVDLVSLAEQASRHLFTIDGGSVGRSQVDDPGLFAPTLDTTVVSGDEGIGEPDVVVQRPADADHGEFEFQLGADPVLDDGQVHGLEALRMAWGLGGWAVGPEIE
jgi:hypothetical protein